MSDATHQSSQKALWNVPNVLTIARIVLSIVIFVLIPFKFYITSLVLFVIAAVTDYVDGWWARKFNQQTQFAVCKIPNQIEI